MAFLENIFVRRIFRVWKHCSRRPRVVTRDFYHQHFLCGVRATSSLELILHLRRVVQQKNQFFFFQILDRGQKYLIRVFPPVIEQPKTNHLGKSFWEIKFHQQLVSAAAKIIFIPYHVSSAAICEQRAFDWPVL